MIQHCDIRSGLAPDGSALMEIRAYLSSRGTCEGKGCSRPATRVIRDLSQSQSTPKLVALCGTCGAGSGHSNASPGGEQRSADAPRPAGDRRSSIVADCVLDHVGHRKAVIRRHLGK